MQQQMRSHIALSLSFYPHTPNCSYFLFERCCLVYRMLGLACCLSQNARSSCKAETSVGQLYESSDFNLDISEGRNLTSFA